MAGLTSPLYRTTAVDFDHMPGELPSGTIPEDANYQECASLAITMLNNLQSDNLTSNAIWRDLLALSQTFRCFYSQERVYSAFQSLSIQAQVGEVSQTSSTARFSGFNWIDVDFTFQVRHGDLTGSAAGIVSILQCPDKVWRIWMLRTWLECFEGHGHPDQARLPQSFGDKAGTERVEPLGAIIIGAGQAGLSTAGRLQALGISYITFEKTPYVGDVWRNRYQSLKIHTPKEYGPLALGARFPPDEPQMMSARRMGDAYEAWVKENGVNVHTSSTVQSASYDDGAKLWTVIVSAPSGRSTHVARNLVMTIGPGFATPVLPNWATKQNVSASDFRGDVLHGSEWQCAKKWHGKRGVVVGTANTGSDVAVDMADAGMQPTMIQRGATFVLPVEWLHAAFAQDYHVGKPTALADRETATYPNKIVRDMTNMIVHGLIDSNGERFDALEKAGFKVDRRGDLYSCLFDRFGGHVIDHGSSARIVKGDINVKTQPIKGLYEDGLELQDGSKIPADVVVLATGFSHDFRADAAKIIGQQSADRMDDYGSLSIEGEMRGFARFSGRKLTLPHGTISKCSLHWCSLTSHP